MQGISRRLARAKRDLHQVSLPSGLRRVRDHHREADILQSFGSVLYAPSYDQIRILLDVLGEIGKRYIIAEGNAPPETKEMLRSRVGKGKDKGLLVTWAPQRAVLSHKVCWSVAAILSCHPS